MKKFNQRFLNQLFSLLVFCLFCSAVIFLAGELALRINPAISQSQKNNAWLRSLMAYDELLGWRQVPNASVRSQTGEYDVDYKINSQGLRSQDNGYDKAKPEFRILALGDSITFGWGVNAEERFTDILENYFTTLRVINAGVQGYGIDQELLWFKKEGIKYRPDLILLYVIPDDFTRACYSKMWDRPKPKFLLTGNNSLMLSNVPVPRVDVFSFRNPTLDQLRYYLIKKSYLFWFVHERIYLWQEKYIKASGDLKNKIKLSEAILKEMQLTAASDNARLVIVGNLPENLEAFLRQEGIYYCPDPLSSYKGDEADIFYAGRLHPNALGHKLIAEGIYNFLTENKLIPEEYRINKDKFY